MKMTHLIWCFFFHLFCVFPKKRRKIEVKRNVKSDFLSNRQIRWVLFMGRNEFETYCKMCSVSSDRHLLDMWTKCFCGASDGMQYELNVHFFAQGWQQKISLKKFSFFSFKSNNFMCIKRKKNLKYNSLLLWKWRSWFDVFS